jgi:hypothetical protein
MSTKIGRAHFKDIRQGKTLWWVEIGVNADGTRYASFSYFMFCLGIPYLVRDWKDRTHFAFLATDLSKVDPADALWRCGHFGFVGNQLRDINMGFDRVLFVSRKAAIRFTKQYLLGIATHDQHMEALEDDARNRQFDRELEDREMEASATEHELSMNELTNGTYSPDFPPHVSDSRKKMFADHQKQNDEVIDRVMKSYLGVAEGDKPALRDSIRNLLEAEAARPSTYPEGMMPKEYKFDASILRTYAKNLLPNSPLVMGIDPGTPGSEQTIVAYANGRFEVIPAGIPPSDASKTDVDQGADLTPGQKAILFDIQPAINDHPDQKYGPLTRIPSVHGRTYPSMPELGRMMSEQNSPYAAFIAENFFDTTPELTEEFSKSIRALVASGGDAPNYKQLIEDFLTRRKDSPPGQIITIDSMSQVAEAEEAKVPGLKELRKSHLSKLLSAADDFSASAERPLLDMKAAGPPGPAPGIDFPFPPGVTSKEDKDQDAAPDNSYSLAP